jgi:membrane protease YdiL (CAAX protease family)
MGKELSTLLFTVFFVLVFSVIIFFAFKAHGKKLFDRKSFILKISLNDVFLIVCFQLLLNIPVTYFLGKLIPWSSNTILDYPTYLLNVILFGPVFEEWIFRGCFLRGLLSSYTPKTALVISSVVFALIHINPAQIFGALILSFYFGYVYIKTQSILTTIILHTIANASGLLGNHLFHLFLS